MKNLKAYIQDNVLIKLASINSLSVGVKILSGLVSTKVLAIFVGVEGLALLGNLRNFITSLNTFSILGFTQGIVKYIAENKENKNELHKILSTIVYTIILISVVLFVLLYFNTNKIEEYLFDTKDVYSKILKVIPFVFPLYAINTLLLSLLNGLLKLKKHIYVNIISQAVALIVTVILVWQNEIKGAMISIIVIPAIILFVTIAMSYNEIKIFRFINFNKFSFRYLKQLSSFSIMALFSALVLPILYIQIRNYIIDSDSMLGAGYWEAMQRISNYYLMFATSLITLYLLPKYSTLKSKHELKQEIWQFYKTIIPFFAIALVAVYFLRVVIIKLFLTDNFLPTENLFFWQLLGDFIKVLSLVISFLLLAKRMIWQYLITEAISVISLYLLSIHFIDLYGARGATIAHTITYVLHFAIILFIFKDVLLSKKIVK